MENYSGWFYANVDEVHVPTKEYIQLLMKRGIDPQRMKYFAEGSILLFFSPRPRGEISLRAFNSAASKRFQAAVSGARLEKDKNLNFLFDIYQRLKPAQPELALIIAGDGPHMKGIEGTRGRRPAYYVYGRAQLR